MIQQKQGYTLVSIIPYAEIQEFCAVWCQSTISFEEDDEHYVRCWLPNACIDWAYYAATERLRPYHRAVELFPII